MRIVHASTRRGRALLAAAAVAAGCGGTYQLGVRSSRGADLVPAGTSTGTANSLRYREHGGLLSKVVSLVAVAGAAPSPPRGHASVTTEKHTEVRSDGSVWEVTTRTTHVTPPTEEELAAYRRHVAEYAEEVAPAILATQSAANLTIDVALTSLGGDASGATVYELDPIATRGDLTISVGWGVGGYVFHDRKVRSVNAPGAGSGGSLAQTERVDNVTYAWLGFPVRAQYEIAPFLAAYARYDFNLLSTFGSNYYAQPWRFGLDLGVWRMTIGVEASLDSLRPSSAAYSAEVGLAF